MRRSRTARRKFPRLRQIQTDFAFATVADVTAAMAATVDGFDLVTAAALAAAPNGVLVACEVVDPINTPTVVLGDRNAYDFRLIVSRKLYDCAVGTAKSPSLATLAPGVAVHVHPLDVARIGSAIGREVKVTSNKAAIVLTLAADVSVQRGTAWVPFNQPGVRVGELIDAAGAVTDVRIESL